MDSDGELRLTIMATLVQEESRKKNNGHTIQRDCVAVFISGAVRLCPMWRTQPLRCVRRSCIFMTKDEGIVWSNCAKIKR